MRAKIQFLKLRNLESEHDKMCLMKIKSVWKENKTKLLQELSCQAIDLDQRRNAKQHRMNITLKNKFKKLVQTLGQEQFLQEIWGLNKKMGFLLHP